jgi:hypothetical protein
MILTFLHVTNNYHQHTAVKSLVQHQSFHISERIVEFNVKVKEAVLVVFFLLGNSPAFEFRRRGITQKKAYSIHKLQIKKLSLLCTIPWNVWVSELVKEPHSLNPSFRGEQSSWCCSSSLWKRSRCCMGRRVKGTHRYSGSGGGDNTDRTNVAL